MMESKYSIGRVHRVHPNKLIIEVPDTKEIDFVYNGEFYQTNGINTYITVYKENSDKFIFQIIGLYEQERTLLEEETSKLSSHAYFECTPIGEIEEGIFEYGLLNYPMIGDEVYLTSIKDLDIIFNKTDAAIELGVIPSQNNYSPSISLNELFTHHTSVLGNTNSGKSTTARKLIQSLEENKKIDKGKLNFLIFDIHDEYNFIKDENIMRNIQIEDVSIDLKSLTIEDWINLVRPSDKVQLPVLKQAVRLASLLDENENLSMAITVYAALELFNNNYTGGLAKRNTVINLLEKTSFLKETEFDIHRKYTFDFGKIEDQDRGQFIKEINEYLDKKVGKESHEFYYYLQQELKDAKESVKNFEYLLEALNLLFIIEEAQGNTNIRNHTTTLVTRIEDVKTQFENNLFSQDTEKQELLTDVLNLNFTHAFIRFNILGLTNEDLLFFSSYVLERLYKNQIEQRSNTEKRLVHCIFDEAHQYIREQFHEEKTQTLQVFEKVAREGRKFGLFMIIISQRPSELSQTVLSQCNNFILHRIRNSVDLEYMRKSIPYISNHQLTRLSYMKSGTALVVGEAFTIPMELKINADNDIKNLSKTFLPSNIWLLDNKKEG